MSPLQLLSNGAYHVVLMPSGGGRSVWNGLAITRWREDAALGSGGSAVVLRDDSDRSVWTAGRADAATGPALQSRLETAVANDADVELRRLHLTNRSAAERSGSATSIVELVLAGDVYAFAPHAGRGGWTWYTGSAGWLYQLLVEWLLGVQRRGDRLVLRPLLPSGWDAFELSYRFGATTFAIVVRAAATAADQALTVDGARAPDGSVALVDDGARHRVVLGVARGAPHAKENE